MNETNPTNLEEKVIKGDGRGNCDWSIPLEEFQLIFKHNNSEKMQKMFHLLNNDQKKWALEKAGENNCSEIIKFITKETIFDASNFKILLKTAFLKWKSLEMILLLTTNLKYNETIEHSKRNDEQILQKIGTEFIFEMAIQSSRLDIVKGMFDSKQIETDKIDQYGRSPLYISCFLGKLEIVKFLVEQAGADPNLALTNSHETPFRVACRMGHLNVIKYLVEQNKVDLKAANGYDQTVLFESCFQGKLELVKYLVEEKHLDINEQNSSNQSALWAAFHGGHQKIVSYLIEKGGIDFEATYTENQNSLLFVACASGNLEVIQYLAEKKFMDINKKNARGETPLWIVSARGNLQIVKWLVERGAFLNIPNSRGETPLSIATQSRFPDVVKYLTGKGARK